MSLEPLNVKLTSEGHRGGPDEGPKQDDVFRKQKEEVEEVYPTPVEDEREPEPQEVDPKAPSPIPQ